MNIVTSEKPANFLLILPIFNDIVLILLFVIIANHKTLFIWYRIIITYYEQVWQLFVKVEFL